MKRNKELPNIGYLTECFLVNEQGHLIWKNRPQYHFKLHYTHIAWNKKYSGKRADIDMGCGYYSVCINSIRYKSHRIVYAMINGEFNKDLLVDHKNGDSKDNNPSNLRLATKSQNVINFKGNRKGSLNNGRGVSKVYKSNKWQANAFKDGKSFYIGVFDNKEDAEIAAYNKRKELFGEFWESQNGN